MKRRQKSPFVFIVLILLITGVFVFSTVKLLESTILSKDSFISDSEQLHSKTLVREGKEYFPRQDICVVLLIGTDAEGKVESSGSYNNGAFADMVSLLVFDETAKEYYVLNLNRDTMMDIPVLGIGGKNAGSVFAQLATSHTYGSGLSDSCENTRRAVSDFLYGLSIDYYFSMNMDGISILNDGVGGVEVTVEDDFSAVTDTLPQGETLILRGEQAYTFVRSRKDVGSQLNVSRMERHRLYMEGFMHSLDSSVSENSTFFTSLWEKLSDYIVTDCTPIVMNQLAIEYKDYNFAESITLEGVNHLGERYYEFYADQEAMDDLILELFYEEK